MYCDLHLIKLFVFRVIRAGLWFAKLQAGEKKRSERRAKKRPRRKVLHGLVVQGQGGLRTESSGPGFEAPFRQNSRLSAEILDR